MAGAGGRQELCRELERSRQGIQNRQKTDAWATEAGAERAPLGAMASRDLKAIDLSRSNTAVIRYDTVVRP